MVFSSMSVCGLLVGCDTSANAAAGNGKQRRVLVIGMDGMDPKLLKQMMDQGQMPNFSKLAGQGSFKPLATSMPPQSPVAWSNFISGADPGTHQIYDFIHRKMDDKGKGYPIKRSDGTTQYLLPYLSTAEIEPGEKPNWLPMASIPWFGEFEVPLVGSKTVALRRGDAFWRHLVKHGVETAIYRVPANYPPDEANGEGHFCCLSGMGTPDLRGTPGEFFKFEEGLTKIKEVGGGYIRPLKKAAGAESTPDSNTFVGELEGPLNFLRKPDAAKFPSKADGHVERMIVPVEIVRDPQLDSVKIVADGHVILLNRGDWSDWIPIEFRTGVAWGGLLRLLTVPTGMNAIVRFYVKDVHPKLEIYTSPLNLDPVRPVNPISSPAAFSAEIAEKSGRYYTVGIAEDAQALRKGALDEDDFLSQARILLDERKKQYREALTEFKHGFLFFYFGSTDQLAHMFWRDRDPEHPGLQEGEAEKYGKVIENCYKEMDGLLGEAMGVMKPDEPLIVMSDHGFNSFRRGFNVNTWLLENEYLHLRDPNLQSAGLGGVDWDRTKAYALGINSLYINLAGREPAGIVRPEEKKALMKELADRLLEYQDVDGTPVIKRIYITEEIYPKADMKVAPDVLIGYAENYRGSWKTTLGDIPEDIVVDNTDRWSGDHCIAAELVPGIIVTNQRLAVDDPALTDMAPTILSLYGIEKTNEMTGRPLFK